MQTSTFPIYRIAARTLARRYPTARLVAVESVDGGAVIAWRTPEEFGCSLLVAPRAMRSEWTLAETRRYEFDRYGYFSASASALNALVERAERYR